MDTSYQLACLIVRGLSDFSILKIRKLTYIADGWNLAISGNALTVDRPFTGEYGPLYPALESELESAGYVVRNEFTAVPKSCSFSKDQLDVVRKVTEVYGNYEAYQLSALTRGDPWGSTYIDKGVGVLIPDSKIAEYFCSIALLNKVPREKLERSL